ncbi:MAG TPA: alpha/beta hydrolase [Bacteroidales bacterium]|nr:alpha/beta hydrolase [Bacteroidales bacterium]
MDFNVQLKNGQVLRGIILTPGEAPKGLILLVHGIGEHVHRYTGWAERFTNEGFVFAALDLPGHGRSDGARGKVKRYSDLYEMIDILLRTVRRTFSEIPVYLYGHSMGGGIVLDYTVRFHPKVNGVIATSPWLKLSFDPPKIRKVLATIAKVLLPGLVQSSGLNVSYLSHDQSVIDLYKNDPLVHDKISAALFAGANSSAGYALDNASSLKLPALIVHGSEDMICSPDGSRLFASRTPLARLKIWEGGFHELHNEPFNDDVFNYIVSWIRNKK